jgi:3-carboxy-cis,cis-muconate cycloisomerase
MPAAPADSALYRNLFSDGETARLLTDSAEIRAMLLVEGALAKVQGDLGLIPSEAGDFLHRACMEVQIDPVGLADETATNGVPVPALVAAFRKASNAPDYAQYLHWGATSQDIMDSGLALRLKPLLELWETRLTALLQGLADLAEAHADLPMAARTYGQIATPTSFGAVVASWGWPLLSHLQGLAQQREALLRVSLSGAAGTLSAIGPQAPQVRAGLAAALGLSDPGHSWHTDRSGVAGFASWMAGLAGSLGKMGEDLILLTQSGLGEVSIAGGGASSTMPQKQNPVGPSAMVALARQIIALAATMQGAALHRQQRDGAAWFSEWLTLPQLCISTGRCLGLAQALLPRLAPNPAAMARTLDDGLGLIHAEALTFALAQSLPRPEAQAAIKKLCREAEAKGTPLPLLLARDFPATDWEAVVGGTGLLGQAPAEARAFAQAAQAQANQ